MNIMSWVYDQMTNLLGHTGPFTLGVALMIGKWLIFNVKQKYSGIEWNDLQTLFAVQQSMPLS